MENVNKTLDKTLKLGLIGRNIAHSQSPAIFKKAHPDWEYDLIDVDSFTKGFRIFMSEAYDAVNVTAPFKTEAFNMADSADAVCSIIGASNLLVKEGGLVKAYNTDVLGAMTCLDLVLKKHYGGSVEPGSLKVLNIGLGGAGKAATVAALLMGFRTSGINRSFRVTAEFKDRLDAVAPANIGSDDTGHSQNAGFSVTESQCRLLHSLTVDDVDREGFSLRKIIADNDIIIYSLPVALPFIEKVDFSEKVVIEPNYHNPSFPDVRCAKYIGGEVWLHAQAQMLLSMNV